MLIVNGKDVTKDTSVISLEQCVYDKRLVLFLKQSAVYYRCVFILIGIAEFSFPDHILVKDMDDVDAKALNGAYMYLADEILHWNDYPDGTFTVAPCVSTLINAFNYDNFETLCVITPDNIYQRGKQV